MVITIPSLHILPYMMRFCIKMIILQVRASHFGHLKSELAKDGRIGQFHGAIQSLGKTKG